jgi:PPOX class probable F420-dependent enzyme
MTVAEHIADATNRFYDAIRSPKASEAAERPAVMGSLDSLGGHKYCLVTTFKRSGEPVPTPLWFGLAGGKLYFRTYVHTGKAKRMRNDPRVLVGPCDARGNPKGPMVEARARFLSEGERAIAERAIQGNYGLFRRFYLASFSGRVPDTYVEVTQA